MRVHQFNREGVSVFNESHLVTELHAHPTLEIIIAKKGNFTLSTQEESLKNIQFGLIKPNVWHRLQSFIVNVLNLTSDSPKGRSVF